jgi:ATP synthase protein I
MQSGLQKIIIAQLILMSVVVVGAFVWQGIAGALSALFGGVIVLLNSFLLARQVRRAGKLEGSSVAATMYAGAAQRLIVAAAGFAIGMGLLKLAPLPMVAAFVVAQFAFLFAAPYQ